MNIEERTEVRVVFQGRWVGVHVADDQEALEYIRAAVASGQSKDDYTVESRKVVKVAEDWTPHPSWFVAERLPQGS